MNQQIRDILQQLLAGEKSIDDAAAELRIPPSPYIDVSNFAKLDLDREQRTGIPETIYCEGKTVEQIAAIANTFIDNGRVNILGSRASTEIADGVRKLIPEVHYHEAARLLVFAPVQREDLAGKIGIVTAGTSDFQLAEEIRIVAESLGSRTMLIADAGVASIQRLLVHLDVLRSMNVIIVIAGMEGALPSVVAGLVAAPVIAVPSSIGYGVNAGGVNALLSALGSCAPGVLTVNIDNGFGAACAAHKINIAIAANAQ